MERGYTILSLDLGTSTGWAICRDGVVRHTGIASFFIKNGHPGDRFLNFMNWLHDFKGVDEIFYENVPRFQSSAWAKVYCGMLSQLQVFCLLNGIRMTQIGTKTLKKVFAGNGNADKAAMCKVCHRMGWKNGHPDTDMDHDEADAIGVMCSILGRRGVEVRLYE